MKHEKIIIAGGSGFIGQALTQNLLERGYEVAILTRRPKADPSGAQQVLWDGKTLGPWAAELDGARGIINLTGKNVDCRYTANNRREILESRLDSVRVLGKVFRQSKKPPKFWIQAATTAILGDAGEELRDESASPGHGFSPEVAMAWEQAFNDEDIPHARKVLFRISFVLGRDGGALNRLKWVTRCFLGGAVGSGKQYYSWIHIDDLNEMFHWAIERESIEGLYNATGLNPVRNAEFMSELRAIMRRPWAPRAPTWLVRLGCCLLRTEPELALRGRNCIPRRFVEAGFQHQFPTLKQALRNLIKP
ncbi:MAG: TIGR01777 family oxidoreductase [Opitutales bacterium]